jgi:hypothetical protein
MARVAIVSRDVQTIFGRVAGFGLFTARWANLLRGAGEAVTIVAARTGAEPMRVDPEWRAKYQANGISLIELQAPLLNPNRWPEVPCMRLAELVTPVLQGFDIVYFNDWGNSAFDLVRRRRYGPHPGPVCVTVLHGPSEWELSASGKYPELPDDLHLAYLERYSARHSDFVVSPSRYMAAYLQDLGWEFPAEVEALGLPMEETRGAEPLPPGRIREVVYLGSLTESMAMRTFVDSMKLLAAAASHRPRVMLLGQAEDRLALQSALRDLRGQGFTAAHTEAIDGQSAQTYLRNAPRETLCVLSGGQEHYPYALIEASMVDGLNVIAYGSGGIKEVLPESAKYWSEPFPRELADKIAEKLRAPLGTADLPAYGCEQANSRWLEFHHRAAEWGRARTARVKPAAKLSVDVCVTYYRKARYLSQLIDALEEQTGKNFHVIAVNDGSPDEESNRVFEQQAVRTGSRGWDFFRQENAFVDAARNSAARRGKGELILFVDADDVPALNAVERMREAMAYSQDDALFCSVYLFAGHNRPYDIPSGKVLVPAFGASNPLGMDLVGGILNPSVFGSSLFIVRRSVFESMGGFREVKGAGHEEWEFYVRLCLAGHRVDAIPETLLFYRQVEGSLARTLPPKPSMRRLLGAYEEALGKVGLEGGALALAGLYQSGQELKKENRRLSIQAAAPRGRYALFSRQRMVYESGPGNIERLRQLYRKMIPLDLRLSFHRILLQPFFGPYQPPRP